MSRALVYDYFNSWIFDSIDDYSHRIEVYYGGAGSGKSYGAMQKMLLKALNHKRKVLVIRKVGGTLKDSVFSLLISHLASSGLRSCAKINKSDFQIELSNGSIFLFKGLDDSEKIKSIDGITDIIIEEATELTMDDFTQLSLRLRTLDEHKQIYLMFNPVSKANWVYEYFMLNKPSSCIIYHTTYKDNKFLPIEYTNMLEELKINNPTYYKIYCLGEFATLDRLVFPYITRRLISADEVKGYTLFVGLDFGYVNDPSALVWGHYDAVGKRIFITSEYFKRGMLNDEIASTITQLGLAKENIIADSADQKGIAEIRKLNIPRIKPAQKGADSIIHGIQFISQHEIVVDERCLKIIEEFQNYTWVKDKKTGFYINKPVDTFNHGIDALRYGLEQYMKSNRAKVMSKKAFGGLL